VKWTTWLGGECPVEEDAIVHLRFRCGWMLPGRVAGKYRWTDKAEPGDITGYARAA
jgi:hypothetical protein